MEQIDCALNGVKVLISKNFESNSAMRIAVLSPHVYTFKYIQICTYIYIGNA